MHCPERWGFLRFGSDGDCHTTSAQELLVDGWTEYEKEVWRAREALMCWHYLIQDWNAAHSTLPPSLETLQAGEMAGTLRLDSCQCGLEARSDLPGGYLAFVCLSTGRRICVNGDALLWTE